MNDYQVKMHLRKAHGLEDGETYDPDLHEDIPALAFGSLVAEPTMVRPSELDPVEDLMDALWAASDGGSQ